MSSEPLIRNGITYVTAKAAAPAAGISADYITKLCRKGEVDAVVVGTTWHVNEASLAEFVSRKESAKKAWAEHNSLQFREAARRVQSVKSDPHLQHLSGSSAHQLLDDKAARAATFARREAQFRLPRPRAIALASVAFLVASSAAAISNDTIRTGAAAFATPARDVFASTLSELRTAAATSLASASATASATSPAITSTLATEITDLASQLPALELPQLPSAKPAQRPQFAQLAQAATSLPQRVTQAVRNFFCRFLAGCDATYLAQTETRQLAISQRTQPDTANSATASRILNENASDIGYPHDATKSENVNPAEPNQTNSAVGTASARSAPATSVAGSHASPISASPASPSLISPPHYLTVSGITESLLNSKLLALETSLAARIDSIAQNGANLDVRRTDNVADNLSRLTDRYALRIDTHALSADAASFDALTVSGSGSLGGDLTVAGTITGGVLNVAGISSQGALVGPYVTATSTSATSTFAGSISALGPAQFANSANFFGETEFGATGTTTIATDGTISTPELFAENATLAALTSYTATAGALTATSSLSLPYVSSALLATDSSGNVLATSTLASSLLSLPSGYTFRGNASNQAEATSTLFIASNGRVGVNTTNPQYTLDVTGAVRATGSNGVSYWMQGGSALRSIAGAGATTYLDLGTVNIRDGDGTNANARLNVYGAGYFAGNVGIGTTSPNSYFGDANDLVVGSGSGNNGITIASGNTGIGNLFFADGISTVAQQAAGHIQYNHSVDAMVFATANATERLRITNTGNLGIGSTSPLARLSVQGAGTGTGINFQTTNSAQSPLFSILDNGNVGIGTTTPWRKLSVTGTVGFDGLTGSTGAGSLCLSANNEVVYNSASDSCLSSTRDTKEEINPLVTEALEQVLALNPVSFRYKHGDGRTRYGFIAEDAADVDPHLATYDAQMNISGIDDRAILAILVKAIQDLARKLAELTERLVTKELLATRIHADEGTFGTLTADQRLTASGEVCGRTSGGNQVCLTADQFAAMLSQFAGAASPTSMPLPPSDPSEPGDQNPSPAGDPDLTQAGQPDPANWTPEEPANDPPSPEASNDNQPPAPADTTGAPDAANDNAPLPTESAM